VAQVAVAWALSRGVDVATLVGAGRRERLTGSAGALALKLPADDLEQIERAVPPNAAAGDCFAPALMATLDSERKA
jgi:aryl-alcohol dehydrogenase-like predicted oxidoreductase